MSYATYAEVIRRYPLLEKHTAGGSYTAETVVNSDLIYFAEIELNSRLGSHFSMPFTAPIPPTITDICIDLAYYRSIRYADPDRAEKLRTAIDGRIEAIKSGKEYIYTGSGTILTPNAATDEVWSTNMDYHPTHGMLDAEDSCVDPDRLTDEHDERD